MYRPMLGDEENEYQQANQQQVCQQLEAKKPDPVRIKKEDDQRALTKLLEF